MNKSRNSYTVNKFIPGINTFLLGIINHHLFNKSIFLCPLLKRKKKKRRGKSAVRWVMRVEGRVGEGGDNPRLLGSQLKFTHIFLISRRAVSSKVIHGGHHHTFSVICVGRRGRGPRPVSRGAPGWQPPTDPGRRHALTALLLRSLFHRCDMGADTLLFF